jgi:Tfp pilus assembly protein PilF
MDRIDIIKQFLEDTPDDSFLQHCLALEYAKAGDTGAARRVFEELLKKDPGYVGSYYQLGQLLEQTGLPDEAQEVYERGMEAAKAAGDRRALGELRAAYEFLTTL